MMKIMRTRITLVVIGGDSGVDSGDDDVEEEDYGGSGGAND